jgi:hypothetical protein
MVLRGFRGQPLGTRARRAEAYVLDVKQRAKSVDPLNAWRHIKEKKLPVEKSLQVSHGLRSSLHPMSLLLFPASPAAAPAALQVRS